MGLFDIFKISQFKKEIDNLTQENHQLSLQYNNLNNHYVEVGMPEYDQTQRLISELQQKISEESSTYEKLISNTETSRNELLKIEKSLKTQANKLNRIKELVRASEYAIENSERFGNLNLNDLDEYAPTVTLKLHCMDIKDLRKAYKDNDKQITKLLESYASRYTTKTNQAIYQLMVIALRSELQNILSNLKYEKLDDAIEDVKSVTAKYLKIAGDGNQSIAGTLSKFIGEVEYLFINAVKIEYNYYVKKEQAKQEQLAIKEQMRQEAEERKALEAEKKKIAQEESKYNAKIQEIKEQMASANESEIEKLNARILELQSQLSDVVVKKEEISRLANGKAGNVYIISNLGSFGDNVFKIGMTRRLNPQDRVNELGDASVPFKFDVHSFIFSDDAVGLESKLHNILNNKRVNKVNLRKEFFYCSIDELEQLVTEIEPTAEFNKTMLAEEFRQSLSTDEVYTSDLLSEYDDSDDYE